MFDTAGDDDEISLAQRHSSIVEFHPKASAQNQEEFILVSMVVPHEIAFEFHEFDMLPFNSPTIRGFQ